MSNVIATVESVTLDGVALDPNTDYFAAGQTVTLAKGAQSGQKMVLRVLYVIDVVAAAGQTVFEA